MEEVEEDDNGRKRSRFPTMKPCALLAMDFLSPRVPAYSTALSGGGIRLSRGKENEKRLRD